MRNQPRSYAHPDWVVSESRSLVGQGDWDPSGVSWHLFSVAIPDASLITPEDLHNSEICVLLTMHPKGFNSSQKRWHTFEGEMFAHIHGAVRKCGKYINTCLAPYMQGSVPKFAWGSDSTVTIFRLPKLTLPETKINHLSAKIQRFIGWSEEAAMTRFWPSVRPHTPGALNSLADAAVRIVKQLQAVYPDVVEVDAPHVDRTDYFDADGEVVCMPVSIHTYATPHTETGDARPRVLGVHIALPNGTAAYTMLMNTEEWKTVESQYSMDSHKYCSVKLSEVYAALYMNLVSTNTLTNNRIKQWKNRLFYPVTIAGDADSDADDIQVLYTPSSMVTQLDAATLEYPDLVLVIPDKTKVRISHVTTEDFPWQPDHADRDWANWYMREDLIWIAHNNTTPHAPLGTTVNTVKEQAWWPGIEEQCRAHIDQCPICLPLTSPWISVNLGKCCTTRFKCMQFDDFILSKKVQLTTGYYSVLTMSETSAGATVFAARKTKLAREACLLVYTRWIPHYGTPEILSSDLDPALIGQVATFMCKASGIKDRINTTLGLHCPLAEHRNKYLAEAIRCAEAKGDLTSPEALLMVIANAQIRATQIVKTDGATAFERLHGEPAPTTRNLLAADKMTADQMIAAIAHAKPEDAAFMKQIKHRCDELLAWHNIKADQRSRYNVANNLAKQANLHRTDFGWTVGQKVAIGEKVHTILDIPKIADNVQVVAQVADEDGTASIVLLSRLRPMSVDKPENTSTSILPEIALTLQLSDLIFYTRRERPSSRRHSEHRERRHHCACPPA